MKTLLNRPLRSPRVVPTLIFCFCLLAGSLSADAKAGDTPPRKVTVCDLFTNLLEYSGTTVEIIGRLHLFGEIRTARFVSPLGTSYSGGFGPFALFPAKLVVQEVRKVVIVSESNNAKR
jgi:hypothetical protein